MAEDRPVVWIEGEGDEPLSPDLAGSIIMLAVVVGYPGSKVSDVLFGDHKVQIPNSALRAAERLHSEVRD